VSYSDAQVTSAIAAIGRWSVSAPSVWLKEARIRDDRIRVARRAGASLRQLAEVSDRDRKTVTAIVNAGPTA
jgi:hypothetical protein